MKKRLTALVLVLVMLASSALAVYHIDGIKYTRPTLTRLQTFSDQMIDAVYHENAMQRIVTIYNEMQTEYEKIYTMYSVATLNRYQNANDASLADEVSECYKVLVDAFELMRYTMVAMFSSPYEDTFRSVWGDAVVDSILASDPMTDEERAIEGEISEKLAEYSTLSSAPSAVIDGERVYLSEAKDLNQLREIYSLWQREMGEIYIELVTLRKKLSDGENYLDEAYEGFYREYTPQNARVLETMVGETLGELYEKLGRVYDSYTADSIDLGDSMAEVVTVAAKALGTVDKSLNTSYRTLVEKELYDIEYSDNKYAAGFTIAFPAYETPFIYFQPSSHIGGLHTFFHEFGHFNQLLHSDMHEYWPGSVTDLDASEVTSQALPLLVGGQMPELLGDYVGTLLQQYSVDSTVFALLTGCLVDEFEQYVYSTDDLTVDLLNEKFGELVAKYHVPWDDTVWSQITHIYETPGYYISYAVSAISAMEIWETYETDPAQGRTKYLAAVDACEDGYRTLLAEAKLKNPFSAPELLTGIRSLIETEFGLLVDTYGHWSEEKVDALAGLGVISGYLGSDGKSYFRPNQNVTRAEFVKLLYGMVGGSKETYTEPFSDVNDSDWFAQPVAWAAANGLVNGVEASRFDPNGTITRQDMAVILERFLLWCRVALPSGGEADFTDADKIAGYATFAVSRLRDAEILSGLPDGRFDPRGSVTRAAAATALYTTLEVISENVTVSAQTSELYAPIALPEIPVQAKMLSMMVR